MVYAKLIKFLALCIAMQNKSFLTSVMSECLTSGYSYCFAKTQIRSQ